MISHRIVKGGRPISGEAIGICVTDRRYPLIPGNVANASTYNFPVRIKVIKGLRGVPRSPLWDESGAYTSPVQQLIETVRELEKEGVRAITTACGYFALCQKEVAAAVKIPVFTSPLMLIPLISHMLKPEQKVGLVVATAQALRSKDFKNIFKNVGVDESIPLAIGGMDNTEEFNKVIMREEKLTMDVKLLEKEVVAVAKELVSKNPDVGAIILECSDMPPFAAAVQEAVNMPVFDYICFINMVYQAVVQRKYSGFM